MRIVFTPPAWSDYLWFMDHDRRLLRRINQLIQDASREPYSGIGKPESLRGDLSGYWSRRVDERHRLIYKAEGDDLIIVACRFHYDE